MTAQRVRMAHHYRGMYCTLFTVLLIGALLTTLWQFWPHSMESDDLRNGPYSDTSTSYNEFIVRNDTPLPRKRDQTCLFHMCFDVYHCGYNDNNRITVYIYPIMKYMDENGVPITLPISREFNEIVQTVMDSIYYTSDPNRACLFLPTIDLLNQNDIRLEETSRVLASLPRWNDGVNHLLFNMLPGSTPDYNTSLDVHHDKAIVAGGGYSSMSYRRNYDVAIPIYNPLVSDVKLPEKSHLEKRQWKLVSAQIGLHKEYREEMTYIAERKKDFLLVEKCEDGNYTYRCHASDIYEYPQILHDADFCIVIRGARLGMTALYDVMMAGCIPVLISDGYVLPFSDVLDWKRAALLVREDNIGQVMNIVSVISQERIYSMRRQVMWFFEQYFNSMRAITLTTLQILNDRVFPYAGRKYEEWNDPPIQGRVNNPLFLPFIPLHSAGFTAVILTYDRLEYLFRVIQQVAKVPSLSKILVVWNNQVKAPPQASVWPKINKPLKVVQTRQNKLSNRFYPYDEIETEAILALDDDIIMLNPDEIEFGYEVWREFPDRLVGFPSRIHTWDNSTGRWKYESEWTSAISIVLTGAAFHHKYYSYLYTNSMPGNIKSWVDEHMNCEDIAMNFLIANITGKPPIKVTPRQKFKCPECNTLGLLSADMGHWVERTECLNTFADIYGIIPLQTVEFRADPVLYKDLLPSKAKRYHDIGSL